MGLNLKYIPSTYFQEALIDKVTGAPLAAGVVTFYKDSARTELKPMYRISGTPPNYTYDALPNPLTLSAVGTIQDGSGNDIVPYYYPYDSEGNIELYYITVVSSTAIPQFTREGQPNAGVSKGEEDQFINYITNGQFMAHNSIAETTSRQKGEITAAITSLAQGNWQLDRDPTSTADDFVFFNRFGSSTTNPPDSPRYEIQLTNTSPSIGDSHKYFLVYFRNVNTFESDTQQYTFSFSGKSATATPVSTLVRKHFGAGGDPDEEIPLQTINLTTDYKIYNIPVIFGDNAGKTLGNANDDTIQLVIGLPTSAVFDVTFTNFVLTIGDVTLTGYPVTPEYEVSSRALAGTLPMPEYEGQYLYLPIMNGPNGLEYDDRLIGKVIGSPTNVNPGLGYIPADGRILDVDEYDSSGIPNRRIFEKYVWDVGQNFTINGSGITKVTGEYFAVGVFDLVGNDPAATYTFAADGTIPTNFTFTNITGVPYKDRITCLAATSITAGSYFTFHSELAEGQNYVLWYSKDGVGTKPTVAGTTKYVNVDLAASYTADQVRSVTVLLINSMFIALPDLRGYFMRFTDNGAGRDPDAASRLVANSGSLVAGDNANTIQGNQNEVHTHTATTTIRLDDNNGTPSPAMARTAAPSGTHVLGHQSDTNGIYTTNAALIDFSPQMAITTNTAEGGSESRPLNISLDAYIII